jgi:cell division protein FtsZ
MIFGSVINENLKDEIVVTVIATGFNEEVIQPKPTRPSFGQPKAAPSMGTVKREQKREEAPQEPVRSNQSHQPEETLDIPTFLRNRNRRR